MPVRSVQVRNALIGAVALVAAAVVIGAVVLLSGAYNVAASRGHFKITRLVLEVAMHRSVATWAFWTPDPPPDLEGPDRVRLGAGHYLRGCAFCHGAPGEPKSPIVENMLPSPPVLADAVGDWSDSELFWIVKHGLKYTGMPAWPAQARDDEVWHVVAFLRRLPGLKPEAYHALATGNSGVSERTQIVPPREEVPDVVRDCARCHGGPSAPPASRLAPVLAGQSAEYLFRALENFADGTRQSGIMQPVAADLEHEERVRLARYYANLTRIPAEPLPSIPPARIERGRRIANDGIPESGIPPCLACHSRSATASFPRLAGQNAPYIINQLELLRSGSRDGTAQGAIMATIARRLSEADMVDSASYFQSLAPSDEADVGAGSGKVR